jgi:hypothetical protein
MYRPALFRISSSRATTFLSSLRGERWLLSLARPPASARQEVNQGNESDDDRRSNGDDRDGGDG